MYSETSLQRQPNVDLPGVADVERAIVAMGGLREYVRLAWPIVEPATEFVPGWHIDAICDHLEAVTRGEIRNLIINIPPRCMKSLLTCVMWPTWEWTFHPEERWLFASYAEPLAIRDSLKCRDIIRSDWYQARWGDVFRLVSDQNQKMRFDNDKRGFRLATSVGGQGTGEGGGKIVVDDAIKADDAFSDTIRESVNTWWTRTMATRGNSPKTGARVVIMQRLHDSDLTGHILAKMREEGGTQYDLLCLPMRYEPNRCILSTGWEDPRTEPGELLWPEHFDEGSTRALESELGDDAPGQFQQRPVAEGGGTFRAEWWDIETGRNRYDINDRVIERKAIARWLVGDTAMKDKDSNDYSCFSVFELWPDYRIALRYVWMERILAAFLPGQIEELATRFNRDGKLRGVIVEDRGSGTTAIQTLRATAPEWMAEMIHEFSPVGSKDYRAKQASIWCARDCVQFPYPCAETAWYYNTIDEQDGQLYKFPAGRFDDFVDTLSMGVIYLLHFLESGWRARLNVKEATDG